MAPSRKGKGKATTGSGEESSSSQRNVRCKNAYIPLPAHSNLRLVIRVMGHRTFDARDPEKTKKINKIVSQTKRNNYPGPLFNYSAFPEPTKLLCKAEFSKYYIFAPEEREDNAWDVFKKVADKRLQDMLHKVKLAAKKAYGDNMQEWKEHSAPGPHDWIMLDHWPGVVDHWCSDSFASRSERNKANRATAEGSGATTVSVSMLVHKQCFEKENQCEPRWSDELFAPTHKSKKTEQFVSAKAQKAYENYENAMRLSHGENKNDWPAFDVNVWYTSAVDDRNAHGDNYGLGALSQTRTMYRVGGSSSTPSHFSGSYSSAPPASRLTQDDIEAISSHVMTSIMPKLADKITDTIMPKLTDTINDQISRAFRSTQEELTSDHASMTDPQNDDDDGEDDDEDLGRDGTS